MRELLWQVRKNMYAFLLLLITFGVILIPIYMILGEDTVTEAVYRMAILFLGLCVNVLYGERRGILRSKGYGSSFYRSMTNGIWKEKKRWMVLDVTFLITAMAVFLLYKCIGEGLQGCWNGNAVFCIFLIYLAGWHLLVKQSYGLVCVTVFCLVWLGFASRVTVPVWGVCIVVSVFVVSEILFFQRIEKIWSEER